MFLGYDPKAQITTKEDKLGNIKIQNLGMSKDTIKRVKKQPMEREKICVNCICGKG